MALFIKSKEKPVFSNALTMGAHGANALNSLEAEMWRSYVFEALELFSKIKR